jgi:hypothetical protein
MQAVAGSTDAVERVGYAAEVLFRGVLASQGVVRAMIAAAVTRPELAGARPGYRFGLIDYALLPLAETLGRSEREAFALLKQNLAVVVSAEALFILMDLCGLTAEAAMASAAAAARTITAAAVAG